MCDFTELFGEEIVLLVFSFLPVADLHRAARVNTTWMRIALDQQLWKIRCKKRGRRSAMEHMVAYYKSKKRSVPWREIYSVLYHQHQFSPTDKSEHISLTEDDTVATAQDYSNVTVKCRQRMVPSAWQPFHYYQILVVEKKYTHMSIGITDRDWEYTGNLVGFGQNCYNYAFHSNGLILHNSNSEVSKVPMYGTGDSVGLLVQYEDKTKRPADGEPSSHTGVTLQSRTSSSAAGAGREGGESNGADGVSSAMTIDTEAGNEKHHSGDDEAEVSAEKAEVNADGDDSGERDFGDSGDGEGAGDGEDGGSVRIRRQRTPIEVLMQLAATEQQKQQASMSSDASESESAQAMTERPRKGLKLVLYLFLNGQWCYTWNYTRLPPHAEIAFTVALNGTGACVALNKEEDPAHREKRQELRRANAITAATLHLPPPLTPPNS